MPAACPGNFGQPKVQYLRLTSLGDENIRRLDVAVDDAFGVGRIERIGDLHRQVHQPVNS